MAKNPYTVKTKTPLKLIVALSVGGALLLGAILYAIWYSNAQLADAKMAGVITAKDFTPAPEEQVIIGKDLLTAREKAGDYVLTVNVTSRDGKVTPYKVWVGQKQYDSLKVGDPFLVGPYLERD